MMISDLPVDLLEEILSRVPALPLWRSRFTCKRWNTLVKNPKFINKHFGKAKRQSLVVTLTSSNFYVDSLLEFRLSSNLQVIEFRRIASISNIYSGYGFFICITENGPVVWNPCTGQISQTMWLEPGEPYHLYAMGCTNNNSYKILRIFRKGNKLKRQIYELCSESSWRYLDDDGFIHNSLFGSSGKSSKGNTYWVASVVNQPITNRFLLSFDYSTERFQYLSFPSFDVLCRDIRLAIFREEQLSVLCRKSLTEVEIWVSTKIVTTNVLWSKFMKLGLYNIPHLRELYVTDFYMDHDHNVVVRCFQKPRMYVVYFSGKEKEEFKEISIDDECQPLTLNHVPSLVRF